ncbi:MAG: aminotransferase class I/II-fold pyridoxal phosphate-dependent enzyme [Spirochaetes bacterium]|nr:aminotransferase class I/II-fold pyridoxal phosphate-dependent enzyme [Spirochaetota bacterium]
MKISEFKLETYFGKHEFTAPHLLCCSDCESMSIEELLSFEPGSKAAFLESRLGYSESSGDPALLAEIAKTYERVDERGVLEFAGAQEAIFVFFNTVLEKGDHVICMFPAYQSTYELCRAIGAEVSYWELQPAGGSGGGWSIDTDRLAALVKPNTKVIAVCSPNNPTGFCLSAEQSAEIARIAEKHGLIVFSDEVYRGLAEAEPPSFADIYENAFSLNVMSKSYGLAGLRVGWLACQNRGLLQKMLGLKYYTTICSAVPSQKLAAVAVRHREKIFARNRAIIAGNLLYADGFFQRYAGVLQNNRPMSGPIAFHRLNLPGLSASAFCDALVKKKGVLLAPGSLFDMDDGYFRMGYGRKNFTEALDLLDEYLAER